MLPNLKKLKIEIKDYELEEEEPEDEPNDEDYYNSLFDNWPQMPNLQELELSFDSETVSFEPFLKFFRLCPNLEKFLFSNEVNFNLINLVEIFKLWPKLQELEVTEKILEEKYLNSKKFIDAIAPFAIRLMSLCVWAKFVYPSTKDWDWHSLFGKQEFKQYAMEKIPTLRNFPLSGAFEL